MEPAIRRARHYGCPHQENLSAHIHTLLDSRKKSSARVINKCPKLKEKFESNYHCNRLKELQNTQKSERH